jgi:hypothetical protein
MSLSCECGAYKSFDFRDGVDVCRHCGRIRDVARKPLIVITGGAASGKSTICRAWEGDPRVFALDLDVVGNDHFVRHPGDTDYSGLWGFNLRLALEMQLNGLVPLLCGFCYPGQIVANAEARQFAGVHVLALVCDEAELLERIHGRAGGELAAAKPAMHRDVNERLRSEVLEPPDSITLLDTTGWSVRQTLASAGEWIEGVVSTA